MTRLEKLVEEFKIGELDTQKVSLIFDLANIQAMLNVLDLDDDEESIRSKLGDALIALQDFITENEKDASDIYEAVKSMFNDNEKDESKVLNELIDWFCWIEDFDKNQSQYYSLVKDIYDLSIQLRNLL